jgi:hypothetical protein
VGREIDIAAEKGIPRSLHPSPAKNKEKEEDKPYGNLCISAATQLFAEGVGSPL